LVLLKKKQLGWPRAGRALLVKRKILSHIKVIQSMCHVYVGHAPSMFKAYLKYT